jgi:N-acetylmuramic acid 6-phosphate etherase
MPSTPEIGIGFKPISSDNLLVRRSQAGKLPQNRSIHYNIHIPLTKKREESVMNEQSLSSILSEQRNPRSEDLDVMETEAILALMNDEDAGVAACVRKALPAVARAVETIAAKFRAGGRLIYFGAGTSGRLALLDALECPPTFGTPPEQVRAFVAGGEQALTNPIESAEDDDEAGAQEARRIGVNARDCVVGISASGRTPYCIGAMQAARAAGAAVVSITCNEGSPMGAIADIDIAVPVGPEVVTGSTRLKAGTAQKMVLNMISTASMVRTGRVYRNLMADLIPSNYKLQRRALQIVVTATGADEAAAAAALEASSWRIKPAIVSILAGVSPERAEALLKEADGFVRRAIEAKGE